MDLTLEQKIGQLMMIGWQTDQDKDIVELIKKYHFGNIILFTRNIKNAKQLKELTNKIQEASLKYNGVPAFIAVDQEGGNVRRIYEGVSNIPSHMAIGAASTKLPSAVVDVGSILGEELKSLGVNFVLAPVADINTNPLNPIIATRAFSDDPVMVAKLASQMSRAIQDKGVLSCYKHFIGHGDVHIDSHLDLPISNKSIDDLKKIELVPYSGAYSPDAVMTAHILYKKLDDRFPASISKKIITDLLRGELGYKGIVISDCFEMDALARAFSLGGAGVFAIDAGSDIVLVSHSFGRQLLVRNSMIEAVKSGELSTSKVDTAVERVIKFKKKYYTEEGFSFDIRMNQEVADKVSLASVTIVSGKPFDFDKDTVVIGVTNYLNSNAEDKNVEKVDVAKRIGEEFSMPYHSIDSKNFSIAEVQSFAKGKKIILALSDSHLTLVQKVLYSSLIQDGSRVLLISLRTPYDVLGQGLPECHICLYEYTKLSINSLIKVLKGEEARGVIPVTIEKKPKFINNGKNFLVDNIILYIEKNYAKQLTLEGVAEEFLISSGHLCRLFKTKIGITFVNYLNKVRIEKVKHFLLTSNLRVNEIANLCGYYDNNYFTKIFKKNTGVTPTYFRNHTDYYD